jgi:outer membrane autotransporter protein
MSNVDQTKPTAWQPWVAINWLNGAGMNDISFNGETAQDNTPENRGQVEIGISGDMNQASTVSLRASSEWGERGYNAWAGHIVWNYRW